MVVGVRARSTEAQQRQRRRRRRPVVASLRVVGVRSSDVAATATVADESRVAVVRRTTLGRQRDVAAGDLRR